MKMPFGKHKGLEVEHLPYPYLGWLRHFPYTHGELKAAVEAEYRRREKLVEEMAG